MVPGTEDLLSWLSALAANHNVTWKQDSDGTHHQSASCIYLHILEREA
jgi:hypothetical protein